MIPKDLQNKQLDQSFVCHQSIKLNKINGRYKFVHSNGGLKNFNIVLLESVDCNKDEIGMYKMYQQTTVDNTIDVIKKIAIQS